MDKDAEFRYGNLIRLKEKRQVGSILAILLLWLYIQRNISPRFLSSFFKQIRLLGIKVLVFSVPEQLTTLTWFSLKRIFLGHQCPLPIDYYQRMPQQPLFNVHSSHQNF